MQFTCFPVKKLITDWFYNLKKYFHLRACTTSTMNMYRLTITPCPTNIYEQARVSSNACLFRLIRLANYICSLHNNMASCDILDTLIALILNPFDIIKLSNFSCHCIGACFNPYKDLTSLHTLFPYLGTINSSRNLIPSFCL